MMLQIELKTQQIKNDWLIIPVRPAHII